MNKITKLEDLSNELILDIFDYLHALDLFQAFSSLNHRISSILSLTQLYVVISKVHCRHQIDFLSSHLTDHVCQVIFLSLQDEVRDFSSVIPFIFNRHTFKNLRSCRFYSICQKSDLCNVIRNLENLNKLVSFRIFQPNNILLSDIVKQNLSKTILMHQYPELRFVELSFRYNYPKLVANIAINSTVTSLRMIFRGSTIACSIYSILPILRNYRVLRVLRISISNNNKINTQQGMIPTLPATYENNPPISPSIKTFDLSMRISNDFRSLNFILRCMPNLRRFIISIISSVSISPLWTNMLQGDEWERLLTSSRSHLDILDISIFIKDTNVIPDLNVFINSFDCFSKKYDDWYIAIHQSRSSFRNEEKQISLHGFRRLKKSRYHYFTGTRMILGTLNIHSTPIITDNQHHLFYSCYKDLHINIPTNMRITDSLSSEYLFKNINYLKIELDSSSLTFWEDMLDLFHIRCYSNIIYQKERADKLTNLVDLTNITKLEFQPKNDLSQIYFIRDILLICSSIIYLKIGNVLIFSSILYDNSILIPIFHRLQSLYLLSEHTCFPLKYASKLIERFPSLIHLELEIYSLNMCTSLLNILLDGLPKLIHLKIHFQKNTLLGDGTCLIDLVIKRRCQAFPFNICNRDKVSIKITGKILDIYLNGCSICTETKYFI